MSRFFLFVASFLWTCWALDLGDDDCKVGILYLGSGEATPFVEALDDLASYALIIVTKDDGLCRKGQHCVLVDDEGPMFGPIASFVVAVDAWDLTQRSTRDEALKLARWLRPGGVLVVEETTMILGPERWSTALGMAGLENENCTVVCGRKPMKESPCRSLRTIGDAFDDDVEVDEIALRRKTPLSVYGGGGEELLAVRNDQWWSFRRSDIERGYLGGLAAIPKYFTTYSPHVALLIPENAKRVLDIGCGAGLLLKDLKEKNGDIIVEGIESDTTAAIAARTHLARLYEGKAEDLLDQVPDGSYDAIILSDVLEHLVEPDLLLRRLAPKLASPGGRVCVSIPNMRFWTEFLLPLFDGSWDYAPHGVRDRTHLRWYTLDSFLRMAIAAGFVPDGSPLRVHFGDDHKLPQALAASLVEIVGQPAVTTLYEESDVRQFLIRLKPTKA